MSEFHVNPSGIKNSGATLEALAGELEQYADSVRNIRNRLNGTQWATVCKALQRLEVRVQQEGRTARNCGNSLKEIAESYEKAENTLTGQAERDTLPVSQPTQMDEAFFEKYVNKIKNWIASVIVYYINRPNAHTVEPYEVDNIVFDKDCRNGKYGGDQGSLRYRDTEQKQWIYNNILKKNNPNLNLDSTELDTFYSNMNNTGCAYVALLNTVFVHFQGREEEFEKTFGYPMYDKNGNLNYDVLFADIYTTKYSDGKTFKGLSTAEGEKLIERFLKDRGVNCDAKVTSNVSPENIDTLLYDGKQVIIHYWDGNIYPADGGKAHPITAHDMVITGVTEDGKYIVSSWGYKYYLDPKEVVTRQHKDKNGNTWDQKTSFSYTVITYS